MFEGFAARHVAANGVEIHCVVGGSGPPLLLLHGYPQTHVMWRAVAPRLAEDFTVVAADLRGYGDSDKPPGDPRHATYSKRVMAQDMVEVMAALGFPRFHVVGHDRGARVAHRMALDHAERVDRVAVLDITPTLHMYSTADREFATAYYHWFFLIQPYPLPETLIGGDPDFYLRSRFERLGSDAAAFTAEAMAEYGRCFCTPEAVHATCEDYRAAASIDLAHDSLDREAGRRVERPLLVLWGERGLVGRKYDALAVWREYATDVRGHALPCGHYIPEELPEETVAALRTFLVG